LLKVKKLGSGTGTIVSTPAGIDCGSTCESGFTEGTTITLEAASGPNSEAVVWSGCASEPTPSECRVTLGKTATEGTATFALEHLQLSVSKTGSGSGTVASTPAGIDCGPTCSASFDHGEAVTLVGAPTPGAHTSAVQWSGCDSVNGANECLVAI